MEQMWERIYQKTQKLEGKSDPRTMGSMFDDEILETQSAVDDVFDVYNMKNLSGKRYKAQK